MPAGVSLRVSGDVSTGFKSRSHDDVEDADDQDGIWTFPARLSRPGRFIPCLTLKNLPII